jgi:ribosomal protein S18 acetylase RimI-like enzyme
MWRPATPEEDERVIQLYLALYREDPGTIPPDPARARRTLELFRAAPARGRCLALEVDGSVEGYALLVPYWSNELGGLICTIDELYVAPGARGRGFATELLALLEAGALGWEAPVALELEVSRSNPRGRALYRRAGFRPVENETMRRDLAALR